MSDEPVRMAYVRHMGERIGITDQGEAYSRGSRQGDRVKPGEGVHVERPVKFEAVGPAPGPGFTLPVAMDALLNGAVTDHPIRTCGDCPWCKRIDGFVACGAVSPAGLLGRPGIGETQQPLDWCPLRARPMLLRVVP